VEASRIGPGANWLLRPQLPFNFNRAESVMSASCEYRSSEEEREGFIDGTDFGRRRVKYSLIDGEAIFEGDIVLRPLIDNAGAPQTIDDPSRGLIISGQRYRWPSGVVPFVIDSGLPDTARVTGAIQHWQDNTPMIFVPRRDEGNYVRFRSGDGCSSPVGMAGGEQRLTLDTGCTKGNAIHEIGHAVGLWHEQSREDRNQHVTIHENNIEDGREHNFNQHISDGDDIGPYDYGSIMHYAATAFSANGLPTIETPNGQVIGQRNGLSSGDIAAVNHMYFPVTPMNVGSGVFSIRQQSSARFLDAHEYSAKDFAIVTRPSQSNDTQRWIVRPVGAVYTLRQRSNGRWVDAHEHSGADFRVVTREQQNNDTQRWVIMFLGAGEYTIRQVSSGRFLDAHASASRDHSMVTRPGSSSDAQRWLIRASDAGSFTLQQKSTGRFADAHEIASKDFMLVTRPAQNNATQQWLLEPIETICTIQQLSNRRYVDAYRSQDHDFALVTRGAKNNDDQKWLFRARGSNLFTIQQWSSRRYMDAHEIEGRDFAVVTRPAQNNATQNWVVDRVPR